MNRYQSNDSSVQTEIEEIFPLENTPFYTKYTKRSTLFFLLKINFVGIISLTLGFLNCRNKVTMSLNCYVPVTGTFFSIPLMNKIPIKQVEIPIGELNIDFLKKYMWEQEYNLFKNLNVDDASRLDLWRVNVKKVVDVHTEDDIVQKLEGNKMEPNRLYSYYFGKPPEAGKIHIIVQPQSSTSECPLIFYFSKKDNFAILFSI